MNLEISKLFYNMNSDTDLEKLIENLPVFLQEPLNSHTLRDQLIEIILDLGRRPEVRFIQHPEFLSQKIISWQDLDYLIKRVSKFNSENRAGIDRTLHRISCIRNRQFLINGLSCRIGRAISGTISIIRDLLESEKSILILGKPGTGKTTIIREIARVLSDEMEKRVVIIDTANEIAGESDIPHPGIGRARRMQVPQTELQHQIMIEAVENHMPEVIIIDEIGTELEVLAARMLAEKGVQLVGTTHGNCLENLLKNPSLSDLVGGIQYVTLSDDEAKRRGTQKSILERKSYPAFEIIVQLNKSNSWIVHEDVKTSVEYILGEKVNFEQTRYFQSIEKLEIKYQNLTRFFGKSRSGINTFLTPYTSNNWFMLNKLNSQQSKVLNSKPLIIYTYSISANFLKEAFRKIGIKFIFTNHVEKASLIIGFKKHLRQNFKLKELSERKKIPIYSLNQISIYQLTKFIKIISFK